MYTMLVFMLLVSAGYFATAVKHLTICQPKVQYLEVHPDYRYAPYIVALHRCTGKNTPSPNTECVARTYKNVTFFVQDLGKPNTLPVVSLENHTSCYEQCRYDSSICNKYQTWQPSDCKCRCNVVGKQECPEGLFWDSLHCGCRCPKKKENVNCGKYRVFSEELCGCVCKPKREGRCSKKQMFVDPATCACVPKQVTTGAQEAGDCSEVKGIISKAGVSVVAVAEAVLIIGGYIIWRKYLSRKGLCKQGTKEPSPYSDITIDRYSTDTPTIEVNPGLSVVYTKKYNNNKTSSSSYDALLKERSAENLYDESSETIDWREECRSMTKV